MAVIHNYDRWRAAQRLELNFWKRWRTIPAYRDLDVAQYWADTIKHFGVTWEFFKGLRVLDVGCGPVGLIHFVEQAGERIRIDPLLPEYHEKMPLRGTQLSLAAMGEGIPLAAASIDIGICFNALDHMCGPGAAIDEIARVLRPGGTVLLMVHTFPVWLRPLFFVDRMHPHHYSIESFVSMIERRFRVERCETVRRQFDRASGLKYIAAGLVVSSTYVRATRAVEPL